MTGWGGRVLLGGEAVPGCGGASTAGYRLFQELRGAGVDATYVNLVNEEDADFFRFVFGDNFGNPRRLSHVRTCLLEGPWYGPHPELSRLIDDVAPAVLVGIGHPAAVVLQRAGAGRRSVFMTTGCQHLKEMIERHETEDYLSLRQLLERGDRRPPLRSDDEHQAVVGADLVLTHSEIVQFIYRSVYPSYAGKMWPEIVGLAEFIYGEARDYAALARPFAQRDIDVLFVASFWSRPEKNYALVRRIVAGLPGARIHLVGEIESRCPAATHHGLIADRTALFRLMGRARSVVCPSLFDAAPGILFEASALGCNVVASRNCGNWRLCHDDLVVDRCTAAEFVRAITASLRRKYADHADVFLNGGSVRRLIDLLAVV